MKAPLSQSWHPEYRPNLRRRVHDLRGATAILPVMCWVPSLAFSPLPNLAFLLFCLRVGVCVCLWTCETPERITQVPSLSLQRSRILHAAPQRAC